MSVFRNCSLNASRNLAQLQPHCSLNCSLSCSPKFYELLLDYLIQPCGRTTMMAMRCKAGCINKVTGVGVPASLGMS